MYAEVNKDRLILDLQSRLAETLSTLKTCEETFAHYATLHAQKNPPDMGKSMKNAHLADMCRNVRRKSGHV